jgi:CheY-like chemotaxis protein
MKAAAHLIVVAEDNEPDVFLIRESLDQAALHYQLQVIDDGDEVLRFVDRLEADESAPLPDVILLDLNLPKRSGNEILVYLRKGRRCTTVPVIVMSSSDSAEDQALALASGASAYFSKPAYLEQFMEIGGLVRGLIFGAGANADWGDKEYR